FVNNFANSQILDQCFGGAIILASGSSLTADRCRFHDNVAAGFEGGSGGAIAAFEDAQAIIRDCEFVSNSAGIGGAIWMRGGLTGAGGLALGTGLHAERNMVVENAGTGVECLDNAFTFACNNVWDNGPCCGTSDYGACGNLSGIDGNDSIDPLFCDPSNRILT